MSNLLEYIEYHQKTIILVGVYLIILVSIPLTFMLLQSTQIFRSRADEIKKPSSISTTLQTTAKEIPATSPLEDIKSLLNNATQTTSTPGNSTSEESSSAVSFGPTLKFTVSIEGKPAGKQAVKKTFIGISSGKATTKPNYLLTFSVDIPDSGIFSGLSLAGLTVGSTYTTYIKPPGQIDSAAEFMMTNTETDLANGQAIILTSGDLNDDNQINDADLSLITSLYNSTPNSSNWNPVADFNADNIINQLDLNTVKTNSGKVGASGVWVSPPPVTSGSPASSQGGYLLFVP